ncbi:hypothetical protein WH8501_17060 [Crocosphaera watsonii WH 8501]|uniref:Uncharacterized protein n=4 Tax=Crocosphaera watsonii TaxID=263511 RepID=T2JNN6_CROWT|nr:MULTISPECIES: hypothetical protein [Crocosphaera]EHJ12796.1 hypothetical protein CWATWH0003_2506 [Crocosphaera watsonii WH 0003]MCH2245582.1 hypothetical protein [Crocosphaera sp.]NQZ61805.1 hypothetical protein [Crocosphaera sp.]CCQ52327.1 hypothetical protein CWATWH8502_693 [Crocosphaera watsonii WH 8502]CCQ55594.1 hypothetical protein CWATWH0005_2067 [Crocosphaera watsonii WH 0005]
MTSVNLSIPFEALVKAIKSLDLEQQQQLLEVLEEQIFEAEEEWENSPEIIAEVEEAKKAYQSGDYLTLEDFIAG